MSGKIVFKRMDKEPEWKKFGGVSLGDNIHVWKFDLEKGFELAEKHIQLLNAEERKGIYKYKLEGDQKRQMISKVMRKVLIGGYLDLLPEKLVFIENEFRKPFLHGIHDLHFNISHSGNLVMFVFSTKCCGIDVEPIISGFDYNPLLPTSFTPPETKVILESKNPLREFIRLWTIKESLIKATGDGLTDIVKEINGLEGQRELPVGFDFKNKNWTNLSYCMGCMGNDYFLSITFDNEPKEILFFEMD